MVSQNITQESFTPCLVDLCKALWEVVKSYYMTMKWHEEHDKDNGDNNEGTNGNFIQFQAALFNILKKKKTR